MAATLDYAERRMRAALEALPDGSYRAEDVLEDDFGMKARDLTLRLLARIEGESLSLDFSGTDPQVQGNLNCPLSVTKSAAFFAVRALSDPDAPPSAGAYRPIEVIAPRGCLLNAQFPAAVAAGNVETSSRVADLTIAALGGATPVPAQGQGTMNNLSLSGKDFTYYETLGGGQGGCPRRPRAQRHPRRNVQHAEHPGGGAGDPNCLCESGSCPCDEEAVARDDSAAAMASCARSKRGQQSALP